MDRYVLFAMGAAVGLGLSVAFQPSPSIGKKCETYKVSKELQTSYVLKPPVLEAAVCPAATVCPKTIEAPDSVATEEVVKEEDRDVRYTRRHHRRHNRRWR